jgi:hypothetical protein
MKEDSLTKYQLPIGLRCDNIKNTKNSLYNKDTSFDPKIDIIDTVNNKTQKNKVFSKTSEKSTSKSKNVKKNKKSKKTRKNI